VYPAESEQWHQPALARTGIIASHPQYQPQQTTQLPGGKGCYREIFKTKLMSRNWLKI